MQWGFNAKSQRPKGAASGSEIDSVIEASRLVSRTGMGQIFFAFLRFCAFALNG
jgi:hypothetical protein